MLWNKGSQRLKFSNDKDKSRAPFTRFHVKLQRISTLLLIIKSYCNGQRIFKKSKGNLKKLRQMQRIIRMVDASFSKSCLNSLLQI